MLTLSQYQNIEHCEHLVRLLPFLPHPWHLFMPSTLEENSPTLSLSVNRPSRDVGIICEYGISMKNNQRYLRWLPTHRKTGRLLVPDAGRGKHKVVAVGVENRNSVADPNFGLFYFMATPIRVE